MLLQCLHGYCPVHAFHGVAQRVYLPTEAKELCGQCACKVIAGPHTFEYDSPGHCAPPFAVGVLDRKQRPAAELGSGELNQARGDRKRTELWHADVQHFLRHVGARQVQVRLGVGIAVGEAVCRRHHPLAAHGLAFGDYNLAYVVADIDVFAAAGKEVEQPEAFLQVEASRRLLERPFRVDAVFVRHLFYLGHVVLMLCPVVRVAVGAEGVDAAQRVLEEHPLLLL